MISIPETWRLLPYHVGSSLQHVAQGDALVRTVAHPAIWWHAAATPTLILGAGQRWTHDDGVRASQLGVEVVRRTAGGTAVYASKDVLGLDIVLPADHPLLRRDILQAYRWLGTLWLDALASFGLESELASVEMARADRAAIQSTFPPLLGACFGSLSPYEILVEGRKLVGFAQVRRRSGGLLLSGIHLRFEPAPLARLLAPDCAVTMTRELKDRAMGLDDVGLEEIGVERLMAAFNHSLQSMANLHLVPGEWTEDEKIHVRRFLASATHPHSR